MIKQLSSLIVLFSFAIPVSAAVIDDLVNEQQLRVKLSVVNQKQIIAKQQVTLAIEIATNRWFAKGTRIGQFELEQSVVLPIAELAINGTERRNGQTWATQVRELTFYPLKSGIYTIPAISITASINTEQRGIVTGTLYTKPFELDVSKPSELIAIEDYIVTSSFTVDVESDIEKDKQYKIGEAFSQTFTFKAEQVPGMMLPVLRAPDISGLSIYRKPAQLLDTSNRGVLQGVRKETFSFIFEQAGSYQLSEQKFYWWNSRTNTLEIIEIPAEKWTVSGEVAQLNQSPSFSFTSFNIRQLAYLLLFSLFIYIINKIRVNTTDITVFWHKLTKKQVRTLSKRYLLYIERHNYQQASFTLFKISQLPKQHSALKTKQNYATSLRGYYSSSTAQMLLLEKLLSAGYSKDKLVFTREEARELLKEPHLPLERVNYSTMKDSIKLNIFE